MFQFVGLFDVVALTPMRPAAVVVHYRRVWVILSHMDPLRGQLKICEV